MRTAKVRKPFNPNARAQYNPATEGYGNAQEWHEALYARLGIEEATRVVGADNPLSILGLAAGATWQAVKSAYRKLVFTVHPDHGGTAEEFRKVQAAYEVLEDRYERAGLKN